MTTNQDLSPMRSTHSEDQPTVSRPSSVVMGSVWMVVISLALFFVPLINGLIGGLVGGYKVGSVKRALIAAVLPAIIVGIVLWLILIAFEAPVIGFFAGMAGLVLVLLADVGLFIGAAIGGAIAASPSASAWFGKKAA